jgi:uncharacterized protein
MNRLSPAALRLRLVHAAAQAVVLAGLVLAGDVLVRMAGASPPVAVGVVPAAVLVVLGASGLLAAWLVHHSWSWTLESDRLRVDHGVIVRRTMVVPRRRVQHVGTRVGPLQRQLGLASIVVHTAGARTPNVVVEHLETTVADEIRSELAAAAVPHDVG